MPDAPPLIMPPNNRTQRPQTSLPRHVDPFAGLLHEFGPEVRHTREGDDRLIGPGVAKAEILAK
jgi:hypothetical protein